MTVFRELALRPAPWLVGDAPERDIVLSSRVRIARNLKERNFTHVTPPDDLLRTRDEILAAVDSLTQMPPAWVWNMEDLEEIERRFLLERHLISVDLVKNVSGRSLVISEDEAEGLMVNEEDHIRLQAFAHGLAPLRALDRAGRMVQALDAEIRFAYSERLGFLTACPTNVGTGMRASILLHLPGLALTGDIDKVLNSLRRLNYTVRGFYGEGSGVMGSFFQVSNSVTLGCSEEQIVDRLLVHVRKVIDCERQAREALLKRDRVRIEDRVHRAMGILRAARLLSTKEAFERMSDLRLGVGLELVAPMDDSVLNVLLINIQRAHLQIVAQRSMNATERDEARARYVREQLNEALERKDQR